MYRVPSSSAPQNASRLRDFELSIERTEAEVADIQRKALDSAGNARANTEVLAAEQRERAMLDAEAERLAAVLAASTGSLEAMQARSAEAASALAAELSAARLAFRKRCRDGVSAELRLSCALHALEAEAYGADAAEACGKRPCVPRPVVMMM